ncbi:hypothetical protein IWX90DRAFT_199039 [Phyllosticta citrichinensis]|uniref:HNH endonuclease n=1 Tax=Phyllosticta citrichinensis TaxID=1130410 RepID=A0ABR1XXI0_9PEZI
MFKILALPALSTVPQTCDGSCTRTDGQTVDRWRRGTVFRIEIVTNQRPAGFVVHCWSRRRPIVRIVWNSANHTDGRFDRNRFANLTALQ